MHIFVHFICEPKWVALNGSLLWRILKLFAVWRLVLALLLHSACNFLRVFRNINAHTCTQTRWNKAFCTQNEVTKISGRIVSISVISPLLWRLSRSVLLICELCLANNNPANIKNQHPNIPIRPFGLGDCAALDDVLQFWLSCFYECCTFLFKFF